MKKTSAARLLDSTGVQVLYDDREDRAGVKFKDSDLIGVPVQIVVGKVAVEGKAEIRDRATKTVEAVPEADILANVQARIAEG